MATADERLRELLKLPVEELLKLSTQERARVAEVLLASLDDDEEPDMEHGDAALDEEQLAEIERRMRSIEDGTAGFIDGNDVFSELYSRLRELERRR